MRIGPNPTFLRVVIALGVLFTAACADIAQQTPPAFGSEEIAERENHNNDRLTPNRISQIWMRVARQAMENGHPDTAIRFAEKAVLAAPESDEPVQILARAYRQLNDDYKARIVARSTPDPIATPRTSSSRSKPNSFIRRTKSDVVLDPTKKNSKTVFVPLRQRILSTQLVPAKTGESPVYRIQLGAYADLDDAVRGKNVLTRRLPTTFPPLTIFVRHGPTAKDKRVNFRLRTRDLTNRSQARTFCSVVKAAGLSCLPIVHADNTWQLAKTDTASQAAREVAPSSKIQDHTHAGVATPVKKPVAITARRSEVNLAPSGPVVDPDQLFRIQFAAYGDLERAVRGKQILSQSLPDNFLRLVILESNGNSENHQPINYWVRSQGFWPKRRARALCDEARKVGHACFLVKTDSTIWRPILANR